MFDGVDVSKSQRAEHFEGGNSFHDIRIDLKKSYRQKFQNPKNKIRVNLFIGRLRLYWDGFLQKSKLSEFAVGTGLIRGWFDEFHNYWLKCLGGRPLTPIDFHMLRFHYRCRSQDNSVLNWSSGEAHIENWQAPHHLSGVFNYVYKCAYQPIQLMKTYKFFKKDMKVLEYGCSLAPMYRAYRKYFSYLNMNWHLADIPNHAFHYSCFTYSEDLPSPKLHVIEGNNLDNPVGEEKDFDLIYCNTVFEHLHAPYKMAQYLLNRMSPGGILVFDYILSDGESLDTTAGVEQRNQTLKFLKEHLEIIHGSLENMENSIGLTVGRKK